MAFSTLKSYPRLLASIFKTVWQFAFGDTASVDAFQRLRASLRATIFDNKNLATRNRNQWEEPISGVILEYNTLVGGPFQVAEEIRGTGGLLPIATINTDNGVDTMNVDLNHNDFEIGMTITGQTSGATAIITSTNTGSDIQHDYNRASVILTCGTGATDSAIRQTHRPHPYIPGDSQLGYNTFIFGVPKENVVRRVGLFNNRNGLFFEQTFDDLAFVIRSNTSDGGLVGVDIRFPRSTWSDKLDGLGASGITLDQTKFQIFAYDYQWLGGGRVRFNLNINGRTIEITAVNHSNVNDVVYMRTPTLHLRYEISNTGVTASPTTFEEVCCSISTEGNFTLPGLEFSATRGISKKTVDSLSLQPVLAIRLKNNFPDGKPNERIVRFLEASAIAYGNNDAHIQVQHVHEAVDIVGTWISAGGGSAIEYSLDISSYIGRPSHAIIDDDVTIGGGNRPNRIPLSAEFINLHGYISQNFESNNSEMYVILAQADAGNTDIKANIKWLESD